MNLPLTLSGPASGQSGGCGNVCAPSCFNEAFDIDVYGPDDQYINTSTFVWPGCNCGGLTDLSNFAIQFPPGSTAEIHLPWLHQRANGSACAVWDLRTGHRHGTGAAAGGKQGSALAVVHVCNGRHLLEARCSG